MKTDSTAEAAERTTTTTAAGRRHRTYNIKPKNRASGIPSAAGGRVGQRIRLIRLMDFDDFTTANNSVTRGIMIFLLLKMRLMI